MVSKALRKRKRRFMMRRKRTLDPGILIDYRKPDSLKRFITDRGKIIPRRISGATAAQQREIMKAIKRARYLSLLPYCVAHRPERGFAGEMSAANAGFRDLRPMRRAPEPSADQGEDSGASKSDDNNDSGEE